MPRPFTIRMAAGVVAACWLIASGVAQAEPAVVVRNNGPSANRVDIVIMGDGFTAAQIASGYYAAQVESQVQQLFAQEPYLEYQQFFNVIRVDVTSAEAGADHPSRGLFVNTALGAAYDCAGITRLICVNQAEVNGVLSRTALASDARELILVLVNDPEYGGSGGAVAVASLHSSAAELVLHETGHTFALLADEYGGPPTPQCTGEPSEVNATRVTQRSLIKWLHWIAPATPVPTTGVTDGVPGLYEGAVYCDTGAYRPTYNSKMRSLGRPFEQVNTEQHVRRIYNFVTPIDSWSPAAAAVTITQGVTSLFSVTGPLPRTHALSVAWFVNGAPVAVAPQFDAGTLAPGVHRLEARVSDPTPFVRSDPSSLLSDTHAWDVTVQPSGPGHTPTGLAVTSIVGNVVTLTWTAPTAVVATGYVIRGGLSPGEVAASLPTGSTATSLTAEAPSGVFYLRVHALIGGSMTGPSNEIRVAVNVPTVPSAPANLLAGGSGATLFLAWHSTAGGGTPTAIRLDVSGALAGSAALPAQETFSFDGMPPGTYTFTVTAVNSAGSSAPSNPVTLTFPATCAAPGVPAGFTVVKNGSVVTLSWNLPPAGAAPTGYHVVATGTHTGEGFTAARSLSAAAPPGMYTLTVAAVNPCGTSAASAPVQITIP